MTNTVNTERFSRSLPCFFTPDELRTKAEDLAEKISQAARLEEEMKSIQKDFKGKLDITAAEINLLARHVREKKEYRMIVCYAMLDDPKHGEKTIVRTDTGEVVCTETMTGDDRQIQLQFVAENTEKPLDTPSATC